MYSWNLDSVGNWSNTTRTPVGGAATTEYRTHNKLHQVLAAGADDLAYDAAGNLTDDDTRTFTFDAFNRVRTVNKKATAVQQCLLAGGMIIFVAASREADFCFFKAAVNR